MQRIESSNISIPNLCPPSLPHQIHPPHLAHQLYKPEMGPKPSMDVREYAAANSWTLASKSPNTTSPIWKYYVSTKPPAWNGQIQYLWPKMFYCLCFYQFKSMNASNCNLQFISYTLLILFLFDLNSELVKQVGRFAIYWICFFVKRLFSILCSDHCAPILD